MLHALVLTAVAFVILHRAEYFGAKEPVPFRLECAVINGFGLFYFSVGPGSNGLGRGQRYLHRAEVNGIFRLFKKTMIYVFQGALLRWGVGNGTDLSTG
jgi:hypothetical protein